MSEVKPLYMSLSIKALNELADKTSKIKLGQNFKDGLEKLMSEAKKAFVTGDQERAYVLYYRASHFILMERKKSGADTKYLDLMFGNMLKECVETVDRLQVDLEKRYQEKNKSSSNGDINYSTGNKTSINQVKPIDSHPVINGFKEEDEVFPGTDISCKGLYEYLKDINNSLKDHVNREALCLIIDIRHSKDFAQSQIKGLPCREDLFSYINIPQESLLSSNNWTELETCLPFDTKSILRNRKMAEKIVVLDYNTSDLNGSKNSCLNKIVKLLFELSRPHEKPSRLPLVLRGGFEDWCLTYAICVTNANYCPLEMINDPDKDKNNFRLPAPDVKAYRFDDEIEKENDVNVMNGHLETEDSGDHDVKKLSVNPSWNRIQAPGGAVAVKPSLPQEVAPKKTTFSAGPTNTIENKSNKVPVVPDRSSKPVMPPKASYSVKDSAAEEEFKQRKLKETEKILEDLGKLDISERSSVSDVSSLSETESAPKPDTRTSDSSPNNREFSGNEPNKIVPTVNDHNVPSTASVTTGKIRSGDRTMSESQDHSFSRPSLSSSGGGLSRSYSSPNIVKDLRRIEEEEDEEGKLGKETTYSSSLTTSKSYMPHFDRRNKPNLIIPNNFTTRHREFNPIYGSYGVGATGLKNLGNTCFMNSIIQCLASSRSLVDYFVRNQHYLRDINRSSRFGSKGELVEELAELFKVMWSEQYKSISPKDFKATVSHYMPIFTGFEQQDAHEFFTMLLEKLHADLNKVREPIPPAISLPDNMETHLAIKKFWDNHHQRNQSVLSRNFEGLLLSTLTCRYCHTKSDSFEVFTCLSLPIPSGSKCNLSDCLRLFTEPEVMSGEASWECTTCKVKREATKRIQLCRLPDILVIHLKRFSYEGMWRQKLQTPVDFPLNDLDLSQFVYVNQVGHTSCIRYDLYGIVKHFGTLEGGHYVASCRNPHRGKWYKFDDNEVSDLNPADVKAPQAAYVLFYSVSPLSEKNQGLFSSRG